MMASINITWVTLDMILESFSQDRLSGRIRGGYLSIMSLGILLAPLLSTWTLEHYHYAGVFFVLLLGYILIFLIALVSFRHDNVVSQARHRFRETFRKVKSEPNLWNIYCVSFAMEFFYALIIVYSPLYLRSLGFIWTDIGIIFTIMLIPFVMLQYPLGRLADRRLGEKELLFACTVIALLATLAIPFLDSRAILAWGGVLFLTRVGIAGIEVLRDSYFYKQIDHTDLDIIAFFRTARPVANIIGAAAAFAFLWFFPIRDIFFLIVAVFLVSLVNIRRLRDTRSEAEIALPSVPPARF
jgi:MFS family permease